MGGNFFGFNGSSASLVFEPIRFTHSVFPFSSPLWRLCAPLPFMDLFLCAFMALLIPLIFSLPPLLLVYLFRPVLKLGSRTP